MWRQLLAASCKRDNMYGATRAGQRNVWGVKAIKSHRILSDESKKKRHYE